jgi:hypothetical protein
LAELFGRVEFNAYDLHLLAAASWVGRLCVNRERRWASGFAHTCTDNADRPHYANRASLIDARAAIR